MTFNHLSDGDFEEFCYDLLQKLGFVNLNWRRGSGKGGATPDQGRDIVAESLAEDADGHRRIDQWFVQCKHYERGVPPSTPASLILRSPLSSAPLRAFPTWVSLPLETRFTSLNSWSCPGISKSWSGRSGNVAAV